MNYLDLYSSYPDRTVTAAWDSQIKEANKAPSIAETLNQRGNELFPRFAACYAELRALPRGARRSLQRKLARSSELGTFLPEYHQQGGRRLQHRLAWTLAGAALLLALSQGIATAATITVTTNDPNIAADGQCSLIEAIINANNDAPTHADCAAGSGADTIALPANSNVTLSAVHTTIYYNAVGLPLITSLTTIEGNGATISRHGMAPAFGLMEVMNSGDLTLHNVTLSSGIRGVYNYGILKIKNSIISNNAGNGVINGGSLIIENSTVSDNGAGGLAHAGGGVLNSGTLTIANSRISNNAAHYWGGGLYNTGISSTTITNSTISDNVAGARGGGVYNFLGNLTLENSTISGNSSGWGGGLLNTATLAIANSTISNNSANYAGGLLNTGYCYLPFVCTYGTITLKHTLISGNQATSGFEIENSSTFTANNFNLFGTGGNAVVSGFTPGPTDIVPSIPLAQIIGPLGDNGGPTLTHALALGSPAIDAGDPGGCRDSTGALFVKEQRGFARHVDGNNDGTIRCDIGAFEFGAESVPIPSPLALGATTIASGEIGVPFISDLMISGGVAPYTVSITKGKLPSGLSLGNDGIISGLLSPTARSEKITVGITDSVNESVSQTFTITVLKALRIAGNAKTGRVGKDYSSSLKTRGGLAPFSWSITSGAPPPGLSFNTASGSFTGIPIQEGEFLFTVQASDALGGVAVENLTLKIR
jgi:hypothetical protein